MGNSFSPITYYQKILVNFVNTTKTPSPNPKNIRENVKKFNYIKSPQICVFRVNTYSAACIAIEIADYSRQ
ncbi:hypothetical protein LC607_29815 [Nostoc sp. CHAB 5824]|nr:hypothetical protein [Nostoc sp. CHAB 5824]